MRDFISPDNKHSALIIVDVQRDFVLSGSSAEIPGTIQAVQYIQILAQEYRKLGFPIVHAVRLYHKDGSNVDLCRRKAVINGKQIVIAGSDGAEIMDELRPSTTTRLDSSLLLSGHLQYIGPMEWIMYKPRWGAFYRTHLEEHLLSLGINTVIIAGCNFPNCPRTTIYEGSERDFRIVLAQNATSETYEKALDEMNSIGVSIMDTNKCIDWLNLQN
ncbi:MAG: cysteine hydrolase family protein [Nitrososphaeraceae archaeon]